MATVIDFKKATYWKQLDKRLGRVRYDIDYAGVTRVRDGDEFSPEDPVRLTAKARAEYKALAQSCALDGEPETWALFRGNELYCERLNRLAAGVRIAPMRTLEESCQVYESMYPGISKPLMMLLTDELEALRTWHNEQGTYERNAREYDGVYDEEETLFDEE